MLGVAAAQFCAAQACPNAFWLPANSSENTTAAANINKPTFELNPFSQFLIMALPLSKSEVSLRGEALIVFEKALPGM
jgi:hypothetical protein